MHHFDENYHPRNTTHSFPSELLGGITCIDNSGVINEICERPYLEIKSKTFLEEYLQKQTFSK